MTMLQLNIDQKASPAGNDAHTPEMFLPPTSCSRRRRSFTASIFAHLLVLPVFILLALFTVPDLPQVKLKHSTVQLIDPLPPPGGARNSALELLPRGSPQPAIRCKVFSRPPAASAAPPIMFVPPVPPIRPEEPPKLIAPAAPVPGPPPEPDLNPSVSKQSTFSGADRSAFPGGSTVSFPAAKLRDGSPHSGPYSDYLGPSLTSGAPKETGPVGTGGAPSPRTILTAVPQNHPPRLRPADQNRAVLTILRPGAPHTQQPAGEPSASGRETRKLKFILPLPEPDYPPALRDRGISGLVRIRVRFGANKSIEILDVLESPDAGLSAAAADAIRRVRFNPAHREDTDVDQTIIITASFSVARRTSGALSAN